MSTDTIVAPAVATAANPSGGKPTLCSLVCCRPDPNPADYLVRYIDPLFIAEFTPDTFPVCDPCWVRQLLHEGGAEVWAIVRVIR